MSADNSLKSDADPDWGCHHSELANENKEIKLCLVEISHLDKIARELTRTVLDKSWMYNLDLRTQRSYRYTVDETAVALIEIFNKIKSGSDSNLELGADFGEVMVSMGASRALLRIFEHISLPIAELWKPQKKQNEGFDFHTVCKDEMINFGEAKYSGKENPHGLAINQIDGFLNAEKHLRDAIHLEHLVCDNAASNLDNDRFGIIAAFSINSDNHTLIINNACESILEKKLLDKCEFVYLVGVICK